MLQGIPESINKMKTGQFIIAAITLVAQATLSSSIEQAVIFGQRDSSLLAEETQSGLRHTSLRERAKALGRLVAEMAAQVLYVSLGAKVCMLQWTRR